MSIPKNANIELIKATYGMLKKMSDDSSSIQEEASLLGISFDDNDITLAHYLVVNSNSIKDAISKAEEISSDEIKLILKKHVMKNLFLHVFEPTRCDRPKLRRLK